MHKYRFEDLINPPHIVSIYNNNKNVKNNIYAISIENINESILEDFFNELEIRNIRMGSGNTVKESTKAYNYKTLIFRNNSSKSVECIQAFYATKTSGYTVISLNEIDFKTDYYEINTDDWEKII